MASLCSSTNREGVVTTGVVTGFGGDTLTTTFFAPVTPADSYRVCVPYCFKDICDSTAVSWALVDSTTSIKILPANPSSYTIDLKTPTTLTFTGTNLKKGDKIRILAAGQVAKGLLCPISSAEMPNDEYTTEVTTTSAPTDSGNTITFSIDAKHAAAAIGQVCYSRGGQQWAPVFQIAEKTALYFSLENADAPTLYQEVRVKIRRGSAGAAEPKFAVGDKLYFMETEEGNPCEVAPASGTVFTVKEVGTDGEFALATVVIKSSQFKEGKTYKMCYIKKDGASPQVYEASSTLTNSKFGSLVQSKDNSRFCSGNPVWLTDAAGYNSGMLWALTGSAYTYWTPPQGTTESHVRLRGGRKGPGTVLLVGDPLIREHMLQFNFLTFEMRILCACIKGIQIKGLNYTTGYAKSVVSQIIRDVIGTKATVFGTNLGIHHMIGDCSTAQWTEVVDVFASEWEDKVNRGVFCMNVPGNDTVSAKIQNTSITTFIIEKAIWSSSPTILINIH